jgi:hypothetical protein
MANTMHCVIRLFTRNTQVFIRTKCLPSITETLKLVRLQNGIGQ